MEPDPTPERQDRLALIELIERDGRVTRSVSVRRWPFTVGRALDNDLVVDDPFMAAHHARLQWRPDGGVVMHVGDSLNGVALASQRHAAGAEVPLPASGATLQVGATKLRLRLPAETLPPERALPGLAGSGPRVTLLAGALMLTLALIDHWIALDPGADATAWLPVAVGLPAALAGWCGLWALVSKLFQHRFDFAGHLRIVLPWLLAAGVVDAVLQPVAASLGWPWLWRLAGPIQALLMLLMLREQLTHVLPLAGRAITIVVAAAALAGAAVSLTLTHRATDRYSRSPYMSTLPLPAVNATRAGASQDLVQALAPLAGKLAERVKRSRDEDAADEEDAPE